MDMRISLSEKILLFGGTAMLPGLKSRLAAEVSGLIKTNPYKDKLHFNGIKFVTSPSKANYSSWLGGKSMFLYSTILSFYLSHIRIARWFLKKKY